MNDEILSPDWLISDVHFKTERQFELGRGSDAVVYRGTWHGAPVAVKVLHDELLDPSNDPEGRDAILRRFDQECLRFRGLHHPNIVQFLGVGRTRDGVPVLVTELMDATLFKRYKALPALTRLQEFGLLWDILSGLSYIHSRGIIHRDLTTRNVLVTKDGRAKVADVGVARTLHGDRLTTAQVLTRGPGTVLYMGPEALMPEPVYDQRLDVFSYGVLMMSLILRREPSGDLQFSRKEEVGPDGRVRTIPEVDRRAQDVRDVSADHPLYPLIVQCLQNNPERRPKSSDLLEHLERLHEDEQQKDEYDGSAELDRVLSEKAALAKELEEAHEQQRNLTQQVDRLLLEKVALAQELENTCQRQRDLTQQLSRQRDDLLRQRNIAIRERDETTRQLSSNTTRQQDEVTKQQQEFPEFQQGSLQEQHHPRQQLEEIYETIPQVEHQQQQEQHRSMPLDPTIMEVERFSTGIHDYQNLVSGYSFVSSLKKSKRKKQQSALPFDKQWYVRPAFSDQGFGNITGLVQLFTAGDHLFALCYGQCGYILLQTTNLQNWHWVQQRISEHAAAPIPAFLQQMKTLTSYFHCHGDELYALLYFPKESSYEAFIWKCSFTDQSYQCIVLELICNALLRGECRTLLSIGDSIIFAGQRSRTKRMFPTVLEFNTKERLWVSGSRWPDLPEAVFETKPIVTQDKVHLIGGFREHEETSDAVGNSRVFTVDLIDSQPTGNWRISHIPGTPHVNAGAAHVLDHIVVVGGSHLSVGATLNTHYSKCYALDPMSSLWLPLPALPYPCENVCVVRFKEHLVAAGGFQCSVGVDRVSSWRIGTST